MLIVDHVNTYSAALHTLKVFGVAVTPVPQECASLEDLVGDGISQWIGACEGREFRAADPLRLLGLVALWKTRGDEWRLEEGETKLYSRFLEEFAPDPLDL